MTRRTRLCIVSAAPVTDETINFFASYDFPIYDLLGQSEGTAPICMNTFVNQQWNVGVERGCEVDRHRRQAHSRRGGARGPRQWRVLLPRTQRDDGVGEEGG